MKKTISIFILILYYTALINANLNDGLVAYYPLNNISKLNSTIGDTQTLTTGAFGVTQKEDYINLTRSQPSYIQTPTNLTPYKGIGHSKNWTISIWFFTEDLDNNAYQCLWKQDGGDASNQHSPLTSGSDRIGLLGVDSTSISTNPVPDNNWHNYIIMHEYYNSTHSNWTMILDGAEVSALGPEHSATTGYTMIGDYSGGCCNLEGGLRDIAFYNRTLSNNEVDDIYDAYGEISPGAKYLYPTPEDNTTFLESTTITINMRDENRTMTGCTLRVNNKYYSMNLINDKCSYTFNANSTTQKYDFQVYYNTSSQNNLQLEERSIVIFKFQDSIQTGVLAHFPLDNISKLNSTINNHTLTPGSYGIQQRQNHVYLYRGQVSYLETQFNSQAYNGPGLTQDWTISMWFYSEDLVNNSYQCLWRQDGGDSSNQHSPFTSGSDRITMLGVTGVSMNTNPVPDNNWHNYIVIHDYINSSYSNWTMILDNQSISSLGSEHSATTGYLRFGGYSGGCCNLEGGIRDITIYDRILSTSEISKTFLENGTMNLTINYTQINNAWQSPSTSTNSQKDYIFPFSSTITLTFILLSIFLFN